MRRTYGVLFERASGEAAFSITFPQFPGVTSVAGSAGELFAQAQDALETAIEDMLEHGDALPPSAEDGWFPVFPERAPENELTHLSMLQVDVPGPSVRVNVSLEGSLLSKIDEAAKRRGQTRSALLAEGARLVLAQA